LSETLAIAVVGVGGQGVVSLARMLGSAAIDAGLQARVGQIHGLSQRGGSVEATVVIGPGSTAYIAPGGADVVLALEPLEALRAVPKMAATAGVVLNDSPIVPADLTLHRQDYPDLDSIVTQIDEVARNTFVVDGTARAQQAGSVRLLNVVILGAAAALELLPVPAATLVAAAERFVGARHPDALRAAFSLGTERGGELAAGRLQTTISPPGVDADQPFSPKR